MDKGKLDSLSKDITFAKPAHLIGYEANSMDPQKVRSRIYVGNISREMIHRNQLITLFSKFGTITECMMTNKFGVIQYEKPEEADLAIAQMNGFNYRGLTTFEIQLSNREPEPKKKRRKGPSRIWNEYNQQIQTDEPNSITLKQKKKQEKQVVLVQLLPDTDTNKKRHQDFEDIRGNNSYPSLNSNSSMSFLQEDRSDKEDDKMDQPNVLIDSEDSSSENETKSSSQKIVDVNQSRFTCRKDDTRSWMLTKRRTFNRETALKGDAERDAKKPNPIKANNDDNQAEPSLNCFQFLKEPRRTKLSLFEQIENDFLNNRRENDVKKIDEMSKNNGKNEEINKVGIEINKGRVNSNEINKAEVNDNPIATNDKGVEIFEENSETLEENKEPEGVHESASAVSSKKEVDPCPKEETYVMNMRNTHFMHRKYNPIIQPSNNVLKNQQLIANLAKKKPMRSPKFRKPANLIPLNAAKINALPAYTNQESYSEIGDSTIESLGQDFEVKRQAMIAQSKNPRYPANYYPQQMVHGQDELPIMPAIPRQLPSISETNSMINQANSTKTRSLGLHINVSQLSQANTMNLQLCYPEFLKELMCSSMNQLYMRQAP